jgi:hypothetical protein
VGRAGAGGASALGGSPSSLASCDQSVFGRGAGGAGFLAGCGGRIAGGADAAGFGAGGFDSDGSAGTSAPIDEASELQ